MTTINRAKGHNRGSSHINEAEILDEQVAQRLVQAEEATARQRASQRDELKQRRANDLRTFSWEQR